MAEAAIIAKGEVVKPNPPKGEKPLAQRVAENTSAKPAGQGLISGAAPAPSPASAPSPAPAPAPAAAAAAPKESEGSPHKVDPLLLKILGTKRAHGSKGDADFRAWLFHTLKSHNKGDAPILLGEGTMFLQVGKTETLFSCHVDTCHTEAESDGTGQKLMIDPGHNHIMLDMNQKSRCLGADDGSGVYIMLKMIEAKIPGGYIFHTGEERGGIGSKATLHKHSSFLERFSRAIAFDRAGLNDVIWMQGGDRCASDVATKYLCGELNLADKSFAYAPSDRGSFTDTKVYRDIIPECFNISVGYYHQHGPGEYQDLTHLEALVKACLKVKWESIPVERKPSAPDRDLFSSGQGGSMNGSYRGQGGGKVNDLSLQRSYSEEYRREREAEERAAERARMRNAGPREPELPSATPDMIDALINEWVADASMDDMLNLVNDDPDTAVKMLALLVVKYKTARAQADAFAQLLQP
jgi:hypothetical protein